MWISVVIFLKFNGVNLESNTQVIWHFMLHGRRFSRSLKLLRADSRCCVLRLEGLHTECHTAPSIIRLSVWDVIDVFVFFLCNIIFWMYIFFMKYLTNKARHRLRHCVVILVLLYVIS